MSFWDFLDPVKTSDSASISQFPSSKMSNASAVSQASAPEPSVTDQMVDKLVKGFMSGLESFGQSAIKAESAAASAANATQEKWMKQQQAYNTAERLAAQEFNQASADKQMAFQT